jgi:hypothetical protein
MTANTLVAREKPETFIFLGFTLVCGKTRRSKFQIKRKSRRDRYWMKKGCSSLGKVRPAVHQRWTIHFAPIAISQTAAAATVITIAVAKTAIESSAPSSSI